MSLAASGNIVTEGFFLLHGKFEVVRHVASGSIGDVFLCRDIFVRDRYVAVKVLNASLTRDIEALSRFREELNATYAVTHRNVIRTYEYFQQDDIASFSMEYANGGDLAGKIERSSPLPFYEVASLLLQICDGLAAIHQAGIVHRDLKPENILLTKAGVIKIGDFGVAQSIRVVGGEEVEPFTGTVDYMSPEALLGEKIDNRSDIYGVGLVALKMIAGQLPYESQGYIEGMQLRLRGEIPPASALRADCPVEWDAIINRATARHPQDRYQSIEEMRSEIAEIKYRSTIVSLPPLAKHAEPKTAVEAAPQPIASTKALFSMVMLVNAALLATFFIDGTVSTKSWPIPEVIDYVSNLSKSSTRTAHKVVNTLADKLAATVSGGGSALQADEPVETSVATERGAAADRNQQLEHEVKLHGETLSIIAAWYLGDAKAWPKLAAANPQLNPSLIEIGQRIRIPRELAVTTEPMTQAHLDRYRDKFGA